jgi:hypothetical protein
MFIFVYAVVWLEVSLAFLIFLEVLSTVMYNLIIPPEIRYLGVLASLPSWWLFPQCSSSSPHRWWVCVDASLFCSLKLRLFQCFYHFTYFGWLLLFPSGGTYGLALLDLYPFSFFNRLVRSFKRTMPLV